jgi:hypothetical protein
MAHRQDVNELAKVTLGLEDSKKVCHPTSLLSKFNTRMNPSLISRELHLTTSKPWRSS